MGAGISLDRELDVAELAALWRTFEQSRDEAIRACLLTHYLPFARIMAAKLYANRTFAGVEFDDYLQYARVGLLEALDRFDTGRGFKFETYAARRIQGAILNGLEAYSEMHEQAAARKRIVQQRVGSLSETAGQNAVAPADLFGHLAAMAIGLAIGFVLDNSGMYQEQEAQYHDNTYAGVELRQLRMRLKMLVETLPQRQRQVIQYHYQQQLPFEEIAGMLQVTRGRIAQLHKEALLRLRDVLAAQPEVNWSG